MLCKIKCHVETYKNFIVTFCVKYKGTNFQQPACIIGDTPARELTCNKWPAVTAQWSGECLTLNNAIGSTNVSEAGCAFRTALRTDPQDNPRHALAHNHPRPADARLGLDQVLDELDVEDAEPDVGAAWARPPPGTSPSVLKQRPRLPEIRTYIFKQLPWFSWVQCFSLTLSPTYEKHKLF